jgi:hypothetical protein
VRIFHKRHCKINTNCNGTITSKTGEELDVLMKNQADKKVKVIETDAHFNAYITNTLAINKEVYKFII